MDDAAPVATETPAPASQAPPIVCKCRIHLLNGVFINIQSVWVFPVFCKFFKAEGEVITEYGLVRYEAVSWIQVLPLDTQFPENVVVLFPNGPGRPA